MALLCCRVIHFELHASLFLLVLSRASLSGFFSSIFSYLFCLGFFLLLLQHILFFYQGFCLIPGGSWLLYSGLHRLPVADPRRRGRLVGLAGIFRGVCGFVCVCCCCDCVCGCGHGAINLIICSFCCVACARVCV